jgi:hypothetical protein
MRCRATCAALLRLAARQEPLVARTIGKALVRVMLLAGPALLCAAQTVGYHLESSSPLSRFSARQLALLMKLNHADGGSLPRLGRIIVPDRWNLDELAYSPMPQSVESLAQERKALLVDLTAQAFGAYESGTLVRWGPVSSGDRHHQTPPGVYHLNWHAPVRVSSENPTWVMPWYFNFSEGRGLALHQYRLPGRPASHGCVRLLAVDAKWLYRWGNGSTIDDETGEVVHSGTLVVLIGKYNFAAQQPWLRPKWWAEGVSVESLPLRPASVLK